MANSSGSLDYWRKFFRSANSDIFEVIEQAILVAASDYPQEFRSRRDGIGERLYTCLLPRCFGCDRVESRVTTEGEEGDGSVKRDVEKESKVDSSNEGSEDLNRVVSNYSYDEAEALTEVIEEESQMVAEVLRIKEILANKHDESDSVLFESLRRLQLMELSVETLTATEIGRAVNGLRKHNSKQIRHLTRTLIDGWKVLVDEWVRATAAIADNSPDSINPSVMDEEEEGLPSPPLDEGALLATQTTSIPLSGFFDGMDDDGNFRNTWESDNNRENGKRHPVNHKPLRNQHPPRQPVMTEDRGQIRKQEPVMRQTKPQQDTAPQAKPQGIVGKENKSLSADSGPGRPPKLASSEQKAGGEMKPKQQELSAVQKKPPMVPQDKSKYSDEAAVRAKLEAAKRKLHEGYQQAENAKKQRTIQVMELHDIPKQSHQHRQPNMRARNQFRSWAIGRN